MLIDASINTLHTKSSEYVFSDFRETIYFALQNKTVFTQTSFGNKTRRSENAEKGDRRLCPVRCVQPDVFSDFTTLVLLLLESVEMVVLVL